MTPLTQILQDGGPTQITTLNDGDGNVTVIFQEETLDSRHQEVRAHVPYLIYIYIYVGYNRP